VATWDAREWLAGFMGCQRGDLTVRSTDQYGPGDTQVRYDRGGEVVARIIVTGPTVPIGVQQGQGRWHVSVRIGSGSEDVHEIDIPESDEIAY
jgi:hypothetical protein